MSTPSATIEPRIVHAKFAAYLGWSQPFLHHLVEGLNARYPGVVLTGRRENVDRFPLDDYLCVGRKWLVHPSSTWLVASHLERSFQPNLLHAHFGWSGIRVMLLRRLLRIPLVTTFGGRDAGAELAEGPQRELYQLLLRQSAHLICVSGPLRDALLEQGAAPDRVSVIRRGTDTDRFAFVDRGGRDQAEPLRLLMVGRLVPKKGHRLAFEALRFLRDQRIDAQLRIVGKGRLKAELQREVSNAKLARFVEFVAPTDVDGVVGHMAWADALVQCSVTPADGDCEGIPNVVVEAASTGLPVVGSRHGGIPETIRPEETGLLVPEGDVTALQEALLRLARRPEERLRFGKAAAAWMREEWSSNAQLDRHGELYEELLARPRTVEEVPEDLPAIMERSLGAEARDHYDHRTLRVVTGLWHSVADVRSSAGGPAPAPQVPVAAVKALAAPADAPEWREGAKRAAKAVLGPALPPLLSLRRRLHYRRVREIQTGMETELWRMQREISGGVGLMPLEERHAKLLRILVEDSGGSVTL